MEAITKYQDIIQKELEYQASIRISTAPTVERHLVVNENRTEFLLLNVGWYKHHYRHAIVFHLQIKGDKVWVHEDNTDLGIAEVIAKEGIPKSKIVLGFLPTHSREVSEYAVN